eukprot:g24200.t1
MDFPLATIQETIAELQSQASGLSIRRQALRKVLAQHTSVFELLELPQLLDACVRNQMYEESLELLAFCNSLLQAHEARGEEIGVLTGIKEQVAVQRANLKDALASQLKTEARRDYSTCFPFLFLFLLQPQAKD